MAAAEGLRWPATEGDRLTLGARLNQKFADHIVRLVPKNRTAMQSLVEITHMLRPPSPSLLLPRPRLALAIGLSMLGCDQPAQRRQLRRQRGRAALAGRTPRPSSNYNNDLVPCATSPRPAMPL